MFTFLILGGIIVLANKITTSIYKIKVFSHPEMYDENGNLIPDEIVLVRFENDNSEEDDED